MAISSKEFARKVQAGEPVRGEHVEGAVRLSGGRIEQCDWSNCTFDSTVEVEGVSIPVISNVSRITALNLTGCRIAGDLSLRGLLIAADLHPVKKGGYAPRNVGSQTPEERTVSISIAGASIGGNLEVSDLKVNPTNTAGVCIDLRLAFRAPRVKISGESSIRTYRLGDILGGLPPRRSSPWLLQIDFERSVVERSFRLEGGFRELKVHSTQVNADMQIVLLPAEDDANHLSLHSTRVGGDLVVEPQYDYCEEKRNRGYEETRERGQLPLPGIHASIKAERLRVGGDAAIGTSVIADDDAYEPLALRGVNLRRATIGNQLSINGVQLTAWTPTEMNNHHHSGFCLKQSEVENCILRKVVANLSGPSDGDFARLLDLREMQARKDIIIESITGDITATKSDSNGGAVQGIDLSAAVCTGDITATKSDSNGGAVQGIDLSAAVCRNLDIREFDVKDLREQAPILLEVYGERLQVAGDATLGKYSEETQVPFVSFPDGAIVCLVLDRPLPEGKVDLRGSTIERWSMGGAAEGENNETAGNYLAMLRCSPVLDIGQYVSVEQRLEALGHCNDADLVRRSMKRRQRREHFHGGGGQGKRSLWPTHPIRWLASLLHDLSLGYGTQVWRPAVLLVALFAVSLTLSITHYRDWYQVSSAKLAELQDCGAPCRGRLGDYALAEEDADREILRDAAGLSVRNLVPIIDVGLSAHLEPVRGSDGEAWLQFLRIMGWVIWPVLLTGMLARLMPKRNQ